ncbi:polymeric immunoglobulin receptor-like isoform X2 [Hemibagrus wyckioides]|uniref:polymeric immunoglobulin receptor-like isoform X2 n=1 Tax=Hemibagrus wyckioides TaxID=337641 RepID=UPI00266D50B3|nr:polymeric immunoglobulin receptor-like isoform X2 [Hemibagrus wyckioides]
MKILLIFTLCLISDGGTSKEVTGYSGGGVLIKCKYDTEYTDNQKYFCKGSWPGCSDQINKGVKNELVNLGRFSLYDDTKSAEFSVMIRELTIEDSGTYQCGVDKYWKDVYTPVELKVKEGSLVSREVTAYAGGGINIKCRYEDEYKDKPKSFWKVRTNQLCLNRVTTKPDSEWTRDDRFSIHNSRSAGFFSVFIRELITEDTGSYGCGVVVSDELEIYTVVKLNVREDLSYEKSIRKTVHAGGDLTLSCKYPKSHMSNPKFLCTMKLLNFAWSNKDSVKESRKNVTMGKFSLYDDRAKQTFSVIIRDVTEQDSGEYWCGAEAAWTSDHGYKVYFTRINLTVTDPHVPVSTSKPTQPPSSSSSSSSSSPILLFTDKHKSSSTSSSPPAASTVITVSVILLLLLIGIIILLVALQKRQKLLGSASTPGRRSVKDTGNNQGVPLDACEYEEIKDTRRLSASDAGTFTVYSTAELPTIPSDHHTVYANSDLPTSPCDSALLSGMHFRVPCGHFRFRDATSGFAISFPVSAILCSSALYKLASSPCSLPDGLFSQP